MTVKRQQNTHEKTRLEWVARYVTNTQPSFTCLKLTIERLELGVKYVQS